MVNIQRSSNDYGYVDIDDVEVPLAGEVEIGGAKNAALAILAASIMTDETVLIENVPDVRDTNVLIAAMESVGASVIRQDRHTVKINGSQIHNFVIDDYEEGKLSFFCENFEIFDANG